MRITYLWCRSWAPIKANRKSGSESSGIESGLSDRTDSENCQMLLTESAYIQVHNNQNNNSKHKKKLAYTQSGKRKKKMKELKL